MNFLERFQTLFLIAGVGFFLLSFVGMGLAPWTTLSDLKPPENFTPRTELEEEGRQIFIKEACWHCHTQFVRPVSDEEVRYGPVSDASEYVFEIPQLFGTRRIGPDLAREAGKRTDDWHYAHFYNPRSTVPWSVMPAFPWLFEEKEGKIVPTRKAEALVAYMQSLGRLKLAAMQEAEAAFRKRFQPPTAPPETEALVKRGEYLYRLECRGCHGEKGDGFGPAKPFLMPPAQDLTTVHPTPEYVYQVLTLGVPGSSMPHFRLYSSEDRWALAFYVRTLFRKPMRPTHIQKTPELIQRGKTLYDQICVTCHGPQGRGDGPAGAALRPAPANFQQLRPSLMHTFSVLRTGIPGTAMTNYQTLPEEDRWALAFYVEELTGEYPEPSPAGAPMASVEPAPQMPAPAPEPAAPVAPAPEPTPELLKKGKALYEAVCFTCHNLNGDGKGPAGIALNPPPANFLDSEWKHGSRPEDIHRVIMNGVPGTGMAPYSHLPADDLWGVTYYVKSFTDPKLKRLIQ